MYCNKDYFIGNILGYKHILFNHKLIVKLSTLFKVGFSYLATSVLEHKCFVLCWYKTKYCFINTNRC